MCIYVFVVSFHWTNRETFNLYPDNTTAAHPRRWWAQMPKGNLFRVRAKFQKKKGRSTDLFFPKGLYPTKSLVISGVLSSKFKRIKLESNSYIVIFLYIYICVTMVSTLSGLLVQAIHTCARQITCFGFATHSRPQPCESARRVSLPVDLPVIRGAPREPWIVILWMPSCTDWKSFAVLRSEP